MTTPTTMTLTKLYFGFNNAAGTMRVVSENEFQWFLAHVVSSRFAGFTVYEAVGYWRGKPEMSRVVEVIWTMGSEADAERIEAIREAYRVNFNQESVLRVDAAVGVSF